MIIERLIITFGIALLTLAFIGLVMVLRSDVPSEDEDGTL